MTELYLILQPLGSRPVILYRVGHGGEERCDLHDYAEAAARFGMSLIVWCPIFRPYIFARERHGAGTSGALS